MTERQLKILQAVVDEYIVTGEPVSSKLLAEKFENKISSATIRNEMATLEQLGYLEHPHTSAGRVPTFKGYRMYIENLMTPKELSDDEKRMIDTMLDNGAASEEALLQNAVCALSEITRCAAVILDHSPQFSVITNVEVIPTGRRMYVMLLITSSGNVKNKVCRLQFDLTNEELDFFKQFIKEHLQGVSLENLSEDVIEQLASTLGGYMLSLSPLLYTVYEMSNEMVSTEVEVAGQSNLLRLDDVSPAQIVSFLDRKDELSRLLNNSFSGVHVMLGDEGGPLVATNSSIITSNYKKSNKTAGALGIIGPLRLDYSSMLPYIEYFTEKITGLLSDSEENDGEGGDNFGK
ncbi:MAG: heat-inducible transcriptional repressor HrcA [Oscillospiraceae bacterium]